MPVTYKSAERTNGLGFLQVLGLIFITLKLVGEIGWSWWWVTAPLWIPLAVVGLFLLVFGAFALANALFSGRRRKRISPPSRYSR